MRKTLRLAKREYLAAVRTKGFIIGILLAPVLMGGSGIAMVLLKDRVDTTDKRVALVDRSRIMADILVEAANERNDREVYDEESGKKVKPAYVFEVVEPDTEDPNAQRLALSDRVRDGRLHAFVEIGADIAHPSGAPEASRIAYHAKNAVMDDLRRWIVWPINNHLRKVRLADAGIGESDVKDLFHWVSVEGLRLVSMDEETGQVQDAQRSSEGEAIGVPIVLLMLMFLMVMMGAVPLLQSVMEEKSQRIAEVLLGSIHPFQFMMGKVLGGVGVSLTGSSVYVIGGIVALSRLGLAEYIPYRILPWFFGYMILAIIMLGAMLAALGSACNDAKDAQSLTMPAMLPVMVPMFVLMPVLKQPLSDFATGLSLIPLFTPMVMLLRLSTPSGIPSWQPWVGLGGVLLFTVLSIWAGGRIFRIGILMQGTPPKLTRILRWAIRG